MTHQRNANDNCGAVTSSLGEDVEKLRQSVGTLPGPRVAPPLIVISGLPGTGKSYFCHKLAEQTSFVVLATDNLRRVLFSSPRHDEAENKRLFAACHALIEDLLRRGIPLIFDATNLRERHREYLYRAAERAEASLILVWLEAPAEVVRQRLLARQEAGAPEYGSEAGWDVYRRMKPRGQRISRNHFVVDTSQDITDGINKIVRATRK